MDIMSELKNIYEQIKPYAPYVGALVGVAILIAILRRD